MARINKFLYPFNIQQCFDGKWETVCAEDSYREARQRMREYRENQGEYPVRIVKGREPNPAHPRP
jgi:hypothetical protein